MSRPVVIDIGCARHDNAYSVERLIADYQPDALYGFDPNAHDHDETINGTLVSICQKAAWTHHGDIPFRRDGIRSHVDDTGAELVPAFDLAAFIEALDSHNIILKIDAEGSEYPLLEQLIDRGLDARIRLALVEWHPPTRDGDPRRARIEETIACELQEWEW